MIFGGEDRQVILAYFLLLRDNWKKTRGKLDTDFLLELRINACAGVSGDLLYHLFLSS